jgi:hypothetical protein
VSEGRPLPWRMLSLCFVPFAGLAAATGLQRWFDGPAPTGDALLRWLLFASVAGLFVGGSTGVVLGRNRAERYGWTFWGVVGPWCVTVAVTGILAGALDLRERWADHELAVCRAAGRAVCTPSEFRAACAGSASSDAGIRAAAIRGLGLPLSKDCAQGRCRSQWSYDGPWTAEGSTTRQICALVGDGHAARWMLLAGDEQ